MKPYLSLAEFQQDVRNFMIDRPEAAPEYIRDLMRKDNPTLPETGELLKKIYFCPRGEGSEETVGPKLMEIAAGGLSVFARDGFLSFGKNGDALKMRMALMRDGGEPPIPGLPWPDPSEDPDLKDKDLPLLIPMSEIPLPEENTGEEGASSDPAS